MNEEKKYQTVSASYLGELHTINVGDWKYQKPERDIDKCTGCGLCWFCCPTQTIYKKDTKYEVDLDWCKGCGICAEECPVQAIRMVEL